MTVNAQNRQTSLSCPPSPQKLRDSNMELLRCVAMLLVVGVHACWWTLGAPTHEQVRATPLPAFTTSLFEALCIGCVDIFVLISGWFGIRPKVKSFAKLLFQVFFCTLGVYFVFVVAGWTDFSVKGLGTMLLFGKPYWFVKPTSDCICSRRSSTLSSPPVRADRLRPFCSLISLSSSFMAGWRQRLQTLQKDIPQCRSFSFTSSPATYARTI